MFEPNQMVRKPLSSMQPGPFSDPAVGGMGLRVRSNSAMLTG